MDKTVLIYLKKDNKYLMLLRNKKENDLNEGKWIGIGGHIEQNETTEEALIREVKEETNLDLISYKSRGYIHFINDEYEEIMYLFTSDNFEGNLIECNEGTLKWIDEKDILNLNLWEGDRIFLPTLLYKEEEIKLELIYKGKKLVNCKNI